MLSEGGDEARKCNVVRSEAEKKFKVEREDVPAGERNDKSRTRI